ncbi:MAG: hypothetical protein HDQ92_07135 [Desulfovibrio sp.]|nr:hypothetical protein [Desulfovibrio sp.]
MGFVVLVSLCRACAAQITPKLSVKNSLASAVATQEATDEDSSKLPQKSINDAAVAIRKQAEPANGYRFGAGCVREKFSWSST